jgi:hypothetical protein
MPYPGMSRFQRFNLVLKMIQKAVMLTGAIHIFPSSFPFVQEDWPDQEIPNPANPFIP